jgi:TonB-dependent receptor
MPKKYQIIFLLFVIITLVNDQVICAPTGKITGVVIDSSTNQPLFGANIILVGTSLGAAADIEGKYFVPNVPPGSYTLKATYIGYKSLAVKIQIKDGEHIEQNFKLEAVGVVGKTVVVTTQASGQSAAINQQLASDKIVNVVSSAKIQALPDANAAESVGRLPGVYLVRTGGEGAEVAIRGLEPKYNEIMIDGVRMAATDIDDRGTDLSMISSNILSGIEVYKTVTPDMDAAVLGGVVNFQLREAKKTASGAPKINLSMQGGYDNLQNKYNDYKFSGSIEDRFFNDRFGVIVQAVVENRNLTADGFGGSYYMPNPDASPQVNLQSLNLSFTPRTRHRYGGTIGLDYSLPEGKIALMNFFSLSNTKTNTFSQGYDLIDNQINYGLSNSPNNLNTVTSLLDFQDRLLSFEIDARVSQSYSENISPDQWNWSFLQSSAGLTKISSNQSPTLIASESAAKINQDNLFLNGLTVDNSFLKQRNITGAIDLKRDVTFSDLITATFKFGGSYHYTYRTYTYAEGDGSLYSPNLSASRQVVLNAFPWMTQPPYNLPANGSAQFPITVFEDQANNPKNFLNGNYSFGPLTNIGLLGQVATIVQTLNPTIPHQSNNAYSISSYDLEANNYFGNEYENSGYAMTTVNIGPLLTVMAGVRYQGLKTSYKASRFYNAYLPNPYPQPLAHIDTTTVEYNGFWLPDISIRYKPFSWMGIRASYTTTITYPDFNEITPIIDIGDRAVTWHNYALKPGHAQNYDFALSLYDNSIGLFTIAPFLKQIDNLIFDESIADITDPSIYQLPSFTKGFALSTSINDPYRVNDWGIELDWQTHFWYLPGILSGFVLNVNYTHIFSQAKYPYTLTNPGVFPTYLPTYTDTFYTDRLIDQPDNIVNLSIGYDYKDFSTLVSMIYQQDVFSGTNFRPSLRSSKDTYLRWDLTIKQGLPWFGLTAFFDLDNINGANDISLIRGSGFPTSETDYGMTGDLGLRWDIQ